jgi:hypothetical protein
VHELAVNTIEAAQVPPGTTENPVGGVTVKVNVETVGLFKVTTVRSPVVVPVTVGSPPVPLRDVGEPAAGLKVTGLPPLVAVIAPLTGPKAVGLNATEKLQLTPAAVPMHVLAGVVASENPAGRFVLVMASSAVVESGARVTAWTALVAPTATEPKSGG